MRRKLVLLPLAMPIALFVGCQGTAQNDTPTTTDSALESCFATSSGPTKCAIQTAGFSRDPQDVDHDGRPDSFICAHIVKVPHGWIGGAGGSSGAASMGDDGGARPPAPAVPSDADCGHMGCQDQRPHHGGAGGASAPAAPAPADASSTTGGGGDDDMKCPTHAGQGAGGAGGPPDHGPGDAGAGGADGRPDRGPDGAGGSGALSGHGPGDQGGGGAGAH